MPSNLLPAGSDDIVVVGRISLNTKKAKRNLNKIADHNARKVVETFAYDQAHEANRQMKPRFGYDKVPEADRQTKSRSRKPRGGKSNDSALVVSQTRRQVTPVTQTSRSVHLLLDLPDAVLAQLFMFTDVAALGRLSMSCHTVHAVLGAQSEVWCALGSMQGLVLRASVPRTAFRQALFGLEGNWLAAFSSFATSGEPLEVLHEADYLAGGLVAAEKSQAPALVQIITAAAARCTVDLDEAAARLLGTLRKLEARPEVYAAKSQRAVREAHLDLRERAVLAPRAGRCADLRLLPRGRGGGARLGGGGGREGAGPRPGGRARARGVLPRGDGAAPRPPGGDAGRDPRHPGVSHAVSWFGGSGGDTLASRSAQAT
jgi:hypothetical protein